MDFQRFIGSLGNAQPATRRYFIARDGQALAYRYYPAAQANRVLILLHGSATHSAYFANLANYIAQQQVASVVTPDLRGHGETPQRRGDIDYITQLDDDLADLFAHFRAKYGPTAKVIMGGHSSGGGLALRFAVSPYAQLADAYVLLAPYLGHDAPTVRKNSGGWAKPNIPRIVALSLLNRLGVKRFNHLPVLRFNVPPAYQTGTETLQYSYRLMTGFNPSNYRQSLQAINLPLWVGVGVDDQAFKAQCFDDAIRPVAAHATIEHIKGLGHLDLVTSETTAQRLVSWLQVTVN